MLNTGASWFQGYLGFPTQDRDAPYGRQKNSVSVSQAHLGRISGGLGFLPPFETGYRLDECHQEHDRRQAALQSVESTLSTIDYPHTPSKLYTEPARVPDTSHFNIQSLDFLNDTPPSKPPIPGLGKVCMQPVRDCL
jgi:hypothetical protein